MDPTQTLAILNALVRRVRILQDTPDDGGRSQYYVDELAQCAEDMADRMEALDEWLKKGGYLPLQWKAVREYIDGA